MAIIPDLEARGWKFTAAIAGGIIALLAIAAGLVAAFDPFGWKNAKLVPVAQARPMQPAPQVQPGQPAKPAQPPQDNCVPWGTEKFTRVTYHNAGEKKALVQAVSFEIEHVKKKPARPAMAGANEVRVIPVDFEARHYDEKAERFFMQLQRPIQLDGDDYAEFRAAINIHKWAGKTMIGTLKVHFNGQEPAEFSNVEVDPH